ncbi:serine/threonine-protein kinase [Rhodopila sp.]|uniref:serine/threonine-protein kinase n=1 Tax=Rhodopila sp. TaxID=2480087 RepID=UPI003D0D9F00
MTEPGRPTEIGREQIVDVVGSGAMGIVYKAHDPAIGRDVAIKVVRIEADGAEARAAAVNRFRQDVQAAGRCSHASIVGVFDFLDQGGDPAIVMELVEGSSLLFHLRAPERRAALMISRIILRVLDALGYAHGQGIIHCNIKPANILLTSSGQVKIAGFRHCECRRQFHHAVRRRGGHPQLHGARATGRRYGRSSDRSVRGWRHSA